MNQEGADQSVRRPQTPMRKRVTTHIGEDHLRLCLEHSIRCPDAAEHDYDQSDRRLVISHPWDISSQHRAAADNRRRYGSQAQVHRHATGSGFRTSRQYHYYSIDRLIQNVENELPDSVTNSDNRKHNSKLSLPHPPIVLSRTALAFVLQTNSQLASSPR